MKQTTNEMKPLTADPGVLRCFKSRPQMDERGNIIGYTTARHIYGSVPNPEDVEDITPFDLKDPSTYAAVITNNEGVNLQPAPCVSEMDLVKMAHKLKNS